MYFQSLHLLPATSAASGLNAGFSKQPCFSVTCLYQASYGQRIAGTGSKPATLARPFAACDGSLRSSVPKSIA
jgi:hypothetical protein